MEVHIVLHIVMWESAAIVGVFASHEAALDLANAKNDKLFNTNSEWYEVEKWPVREA